MPTPETYFAWSGIQQAWVPLDGLAACEMCRQIGVATMTVFGGA